MRNNYFKGELRSTALGIVAIFLWSTTIAFSRSLTEQLGTFTAATLIYIIAGLVGISFLAVKPDWLVTIRKLPKLYLSGCGALFIIYIVSLYLAVGSASTRDDVLVVGLINYLWPGLSLVFSLPILGKRGNLLLPLGILVALAGIWLATMSVQKIRPDQFEISDKSWIAFGLAFLAAIAWGLYTNLSRRLAGNNEGGGVPLFLLASGITLAILSIFFPETPRWSVKTGLELVYMAILPGMLAYMLWEIAVRKGEIILITSLSNLTPLLSTIISAIILGITPGPILWSGTILVLLGAYFCKLSIKD